MRLEERLRRIDVEPKDLHALLVGELIDPVGWRMVWMDGIHSRMRKVRRSMSCKNISCAARSFESWTRECAV